ncbi:hypothetical protein ACFL1Y_01155 [Patescibacteria group bacterium]
MSKTSHAWSFPEYVNPPRDKKWYIIATLIFLGLLLYSVLTANFLFGLIIIIATIILFIYHHKQEVEIKISLEHDGIRIENNLYKYNEFKKFWLVYDPPAVKNLYLELKVTFKPNIIVPLQNENPVEIRKFLKQYLEEDLEKEDEDTVEALERVLKL